LPPAGGVRPRRGRDLRGSLLDVAQREEIAVGRACGDMVRAIAAMLGRSPSTVSLELRRNTDGDYARGHKVEHIIRNLNGRIGERNTYGHDPRNIPG
jgi:IS30 family transposase